MCGAPEKQEPDDDSSRRFDSLYKMPLQATATKQCNMLSYDTVSIPSQDISKQSLNG